jgi:hypothetical protein
MFHPAADYRMINLKLTRDSALRKPLTNGSNHLATAFFDKPFCPT